MHQGSEADPPDSAARSTPLENLLQQLGPNRGAVLGGTEEEWFRRLLECAAEGVWATDENWITVYVNDRLARMLGYTAPEMLGHHLFDFMDEAARQVCIENMSRREAGIEEAHEFRFRHRSGSEVFARMATSPIRDAEGGFSGGLALVTDITEEKRVQRALRMSECQYRHLVQHLPDGVMVHVEGKLVFVNETICRLLGATTPEALLGTEATDFIVPGDQAAVRDRHALLRTSMASVPQVEARFVRMDGTTLVMEVSSIRGSFEGKDAIIDVVRDLTDRHVMQARLQEARELLEARIELRTAELLESNRQLRHEAAERARVEQALGAAEKLAVTARLAAGIAHEINNPLAGIKSAFDLVRDAIPPDHPYYRYVERIENEIARIAVIVRQMYSLYSPEQEVPRAFELRRSLRDVAELMEVLARKSEVTVRVVEQGDMEPVVLTEGALRRILINLVQNAIEASPRGAEVELHAREEGEFLVIEVLDRGSGVSPELAPQIFEPFFTTKKSAEGRGLGLGLAVSRSLSESMFGTLCLEPREEGGTVARLTVPGTRRSVSPR